MFRIKRNTAFFLLCFSFFAFAAIPLFSMSIGRDGDSFEENGILWQPVQFKDGKSQFKALFPGEPTSGISTPWYYIFSEYGLSQYEIHTHMNERYVIPKNEKAFLKELQSILSGSEVLTPIEIADENVVYAAEFSTYEEQTTNLIKITRIYLMEDRRAYFAIVQGQDFTLATDFFNSIRFSAK